MYIAILQDGEVENEVFIEWCCRSCATDVYGWSKAQYNFVADIVNENKPVTVPMEVCNGRTFGQYIKAMKL